MIPPEMAALAVSRFLPLIGSFLLSFVFIMGAGRVYLRRRDWRDVWAYTKFQYDRLAALALLGYYGFVLIVLGNPPPQANLSIYGNLFLGVHLIGSALGVLRGSRDPFGAVGKKGET